jgi:hypothetical protein
VNFTKRLERGNDISVGADGSIWMLGRKKQEKGFEIKKWTGQ